MANVKCKIMSAKTDPKGVTTLSLTFTDAQNHSWDKKYTLNNTDPVDINKLKEQLIADIRRDLKISAVLDQITPLIGKTFDLSI